MCGHCEALSCQGPEPMPLAARLSRRGGRNHCFTLMLHALLYYYAFIRARGKGELKRPQRPSFLFETSLGNLA